MCSVGVWLINMYYQTLPVVLFLCHYYKHFSTAQVDIPLREGNKSVVLIFLSGIPLMCMQDTFLISFECVNMLFIVEDPQTT